MNHIEGGQGRTPDELEQNPIIRFLSLGLFKIIVILTVCGALALAAHVIIKYNNPPKSGAAHAPR